MKLIINVLFIVLTIGGVLTLSGCKKACCSDDNISNIGQGMEVQPFEDKKQAHKATYSEAKYHVIQPTSSSK